jgi:hypothetical protein
MWRREAEKSCRNGGRSFLTCIKTRQSALVHPFLYTIEWVTCTDPPRCANLTERGL